jgi:two-component system phosphate regulon sensor histidine kinase PhoR
MHLQFLRSHAWQVSLGRFVVLLVTALVIGLPFHAQLYTVLAALLGYSLWSLVRLYQLQTWLRSRQWRSPLEDRGVWSDISTHV